MKHRIMSTRQEGPNLIELYETRISGDPETAIEAIKELKAEGHRVSAWIVDDERNDGQARQRQSRR